jgi:hypothetical protein
VASRYVALGDSYSSGVGSRSYYPGPCERSPLSYAPLLAARLKVTEFDFRACGGATTGATGSCGLVMLSGEERAGIQQLADQLAEVTGAAARRVANTVFVDSRATRAISRAVTRGGSTAFGSVE